LKIKYDKAQGLICLIYPSININRKVNCPILSVMNFQRQIVLFLDRRLDQNKIGRRVKFTSYSIGFNVAVDV
jgi:hypothetical protein